MPVSIGIDIGSNSVGSAWVDEEAHQLIAGVSVFPAGVEDSERGRGAPKNLKRRMARSLRRNIHRRAKRKNQLKKFLIEHGLLPKEPDKQQEFFQKDPWELRQQALEQELTPYEFGRVLVHLNQRRGAFGVDVNPDDPEEGKVKEGIDRLRSEMENSKARTVGEFMRLMQEQRIHKLHSDTNKHYKDPIRNRRDSYEFQADRKLIQEEFNILWEKQARFNGELSQLLTSSLKNKLDRRPSEAAWQHEGIIFGQRRTYWNAGTLGRCDLELTDRCAPIADRWASLFRVIESVNNIRIEERGKQPRSLTPDERKAVIAVLKSQKTGTPATIRRALKINSKEAKSRIFLNIERDKSREINTDWFYREIVLGALSEEYWDSISEDIKESINRLILRLDPKDPAAEQKFRKVAEKAWSLDEDRINELMKSWKTRPNVDKRLKLSRKAIQNLLPYMDEQDPTDGHWLTQIEARRRFSEDGSNFASPKQRERYAIGFRRLGKSERQFLKKHPEKLLPPPDMPNPVVRKAIHEVRRHIEAYLQKFGKKPDRIVIELAREATQPGKSYDKQLSENRRREKIRKQIIEVYGLSDLPTNQQARAVDRVLLCRQQHEMCAYTGQAITEQQAAVGSGLEIDHIVPYSRSWDNSTNNKVLCYRESNRGKGNLTPREWLGPDTEAYQSLLARFRHLEAADITKDDYYGARSSARKWHNLIREVKEDEAWRPEQLAVTGYAARLLGQYLHQALWPEEPLPEAGGKRRIFFTNGRYTALLRRDWQLFEEQGETKNTDKYKGKNRADHRHHAVDAVAIALTDGSRLQRLAKTFKQQEIEHSNIGSWPDRKPLPPPWGSTKSFRRQVLKYIYGNRNNSNQALIVSHRPHLKISGALHEETLMGPVITDGKSIRHGVLRKAVHKLKPTHLRMPSGWEEIKQKLRSKNIPPEEHKRLKNDLNALEDPKPEKSGLVRDRALRERIRQCIFDAGKNPDVITDKEMKELYENGTITQKSGVPIRRVRMLYVVRNPVLISRKKRNVANSKFIADDNERSKRLYISGNNHHIEIFEEISTGKWKAHMVNMHEASRRARINQPLVDRSSNEQMKFAMSIHIGEVLELWRLNKSEPRWGAPKYFVIAKLNQDGTNASFECVAHSDAGDSKTRTITKIAISTLKSLGRDDETMPSKVRINPLGEIKALVRD